MQLEECLLGQVLSFGRVPQHAQAERVYPPLVQGVDLCERDVVARLRALQQLWGHTSPLRSHAQAPAS
jgi:hypothetical protein